MMLIKKSFAYVVLFCVPLIWAGSTLFVNNVNIDPAINISLWRWLLVVVFLFPFAIKETIQEWSNIKANWKILSVLALMGVSISPTCAVEALHQENIMNAGLLYGTTPIFILLLSALCYKKMIETSKIFGILLGFIAISVLVFEGNFLNIKNLNFTIGDVWMLVAVLTWAIYSLLLKHKPEGFSPVVFLFILSILGILFLLPWAAWNIIHGIRVTLNHTTFEGLLYISLLTSLLGYLGWNMGVNIIGAERAGFFLNLYPIFSVRLIVIFGNAKIYWYDRVSLLLILIGLYLVSVE
jgi:drug/metabolite transporter (DMT)-like permease